MEFEASRLAAVDTLTGVLTRGAILEHLAERLRRPQRVNRVTALFLDVDQLKAVNDAYGHAIGDALIRCVAERIATAVAPGDAIGRLGGDEFLIISNVASQGEAISLAERVAEASHAPLLVNRIELRPRVSTGIAIAEPEASADDLVADADMAMYEAKRNRSGFAVASASSRLEMKRSIAVNTELVDAMATNQIRFAYQPIIDLNTGEMLGGEALLRWHHPIFGLIPPPLIVARAEASGQIDLLTEWSLTTVCRDWSELRERWPLFHDKAVSINLTARQLQSQSYADLHHATLRQFGLRPEDIIIELVESGVIDVDDIAESVIKSLAAQGTIIAVDDFGVGYNSLAYFTRFPLHAIKVDRALVAAGTKDPIARAVLAGIFQLGQSLDVHLVAEGIETEDERAMCVEMGITVGQGHLICRPMLVPDLEVEMGNNWREWQHRKGLADGPP